jgi:hypothetical protein
MKKHFIRKGTKKFHFEILKSIQFSRLFKKYFKKKKLIIGSSETTRKAPFQKKKASVLLQKNSFCFKDYGLYSPSHLKKLNLPFLEWFIGFSEGDGTFSIRKATVQNKARLTFEVGQKDPKSLFYIKKSLGFGRVRKYTRSETGEIYWTYLVDSKANVKRIIALFNGNLVLPKRIVQFQKWIQIAEKVNCLPSNFVNKQKDPASSVPLTLNSGWISGFIDADGCFYAALSPPSKGSRVSKGIKQKMHITQKSEFGDEKILQDIGLLFKSKAKVNRVKSSKNQVKATSPYYRIEMSSLEAHQTISKYLNNFPLKTNKKIAFVRWDRVVKAREVNAHLDETRLPKLGRLCKAINAFTKEN